MLSGLISTLTGKKAVPSKRNHISSFTYYYDEKICGLGVNEDPLRFSLLLSSAVLHEFYFVERYIK